MSRQVMLDLVGDAAYYRNGFQKKSDVSYKEDVHITMDTSFTFNLTAVGFSPRKWDQLIYTYIEPRSYARFVAKAKRATPGKEVGYTCPVFGGHGGGNCLLGWTYNGRRLRVYSRVCLIMPTGPQDFSLVTCVAKEIGASVIDWDFSCVRLSAMKSLPSLIVTGLFPDSPFVKGHQVAVDGYGSHKAKRFIARGSTDLDGELPDLSIYRRFLPRDTDDDATITPDSLAALKPGLKGVDIRNFLRDDCLMKNWGWANLYLGGEAYRWKSYNDPMVKLIMAKFPITHP